MLGPVCGIYSGPKVMIGFGLAQALCVIKVDQRQEGDKIKKTVLNY